MFTKKRNNLDEMQELQLLKIEHNACWLAFWGLCAAFIIQRVFCADNDIAPLGETLVLFCMSIYILIACIRRGIWDRKLAANNRTYIGGALIAGAVVFFITFIRVWSHYPDKMGGSIAAGISTGGLTFVLTLILMVIAGSAVNRRNAQLEKDPEE